MSAMKPTALDKLAMKKIHEEMGCLLSLFLKTIQHPEEFKDLKMARIKCGQSMKYLVDCVWPHVDSRARVLYEMVDKSVKDWVEPDEDEVSSAISLMEEIVNAWEESIQV